MAEKDTADIGGDETHIYQRSIFKDVDESPSAELIGIVAELKGVEQNELAPLYSWVDSLISDLYSSPPPAEAQAVVEFTYEGYRITLYQDGHAVLMGRTSESGHY